MGFGLRVGRLPSSGASSGATSPWLGLAAKPQGLKEMIDYNTVEQFKLRVERIRKEQHPSPQVPGQPSTPQWTKGANGPPLVLPADDQEPEPSSNAVAIRHAPDEFVQAFAAALQTYSQHSENRNVRVPERLFLTIPEAADYSGLPQAHLRRLMADGKLTGLKTGSGWRIRRADLEKL